MLAELIIPIASLRGKLSNDGFYFRLYRGKQIVQRTPAKWRDTPARRAARERFIATYARKKSVPAAPVPSSASSAPLGVPDVTAGCGGESGGDSAPHAAKRHQ